MSGEHPPWQPLAQGLLAILDPLVDAAAQASAASPSAEPGKCQQVWCLACATAAFASGEQHPLTTVIAEHGAGLMVILRAMANPDDVNPPPPVPHGRVDERGPTSSEPGRYQPIPVTIDDTTLTTDDDRRL
jgi:hypothetical protein